MKTLMITPEPFFEPRGTPISVYQRLEALASLGHEVDLVTYHIGKDVNIAGVQIYRIPSVPFIKEVKIGPSWSKPLLDLLIFFKALALLLSKRYDVIHSHEEAAFISIILGAIFRTRHLYDMHSSLPRQLENSKFGNFGPLIKWFEVLERWALKTCDAVIAIDADLEAYIGRINPEVACITIENVALHANQKPKDRRLLSQLKSRLNLDGVRLIVYTGTFESYQGLDLLFDCAKIVRKEFPQALFILVGGKPQQIERWRSKVKKNGLGDAIVFVGTVSPEEALDYLEIAEVLVSPRTDGTSVPLKIYSYLHAGRPIVATRLPAHTQVLSGETAILVEPTKEAFAEGICLSLRNPLLSECLGNCSQKLAQEKYSYASYLSKVREIYATLQPEANLVVERTHSMET